MRRSSAVPLLALAQLGCGTPAAPGRQSAVPPPPPMSLPMPVFSPQRGMAAAEQNARCERCHQEIAAEWRSSLHHHSYTEPSYQRALAIEPLPFCRSCHAPEANPDRDAPETLARLGVGCVSCHLSEGRVLGAPHAPSSAAPAPHGVVFEARFASPAACASCHEFTFPDGVLRDRPLLMQSTWSEHTRSPFAAAACAQCHMPRVGGHRSHAFAVSSNPTMVKSAVKVSAERLDARRVRIVLQPLAVGHAFPTGDLFRRLQVLAEAVGPDLGRVAMSERFLTRHFVVERRRSVALRRLEHDDRVGLHGSEPSVVELDLGDEARGHAIAWRVAYQRVDHPLAIDSEDALVDAEIEIASGVFGTAP
jgi:Cytochrome c554 and c-prime